jgi:hypothetical protein
MAGACSPMAQRRASTILDFPQPLGPTMAVIPGLSSMTVFSTKDLNPTISRLFNRIATILLRHYSGGESQKQAYARNISHAGWGVKQKLQYEGEFLNSHHNMWDDLQSKLLF